MRVLFISYQYPPFIEARDGITTHVHNLTKALSEIGCEIHVVSSGPRSIDKSIEDVHVHFLKSSYVPMFRDARFSFFSFTKINRICRRYEIDLVHGQSPCSFGYGILHSKRLPFVLTLHGTPLGEMTASLVYSNMSLGPSAVFDTLFIRPSYLLLTLAEWKRADRIIAVSNALADEVTSLYHIPRSKIAVIHNGVGFSNFPEENLSKDHRILFVGGLTWTKGIIYLVDAMSQILKDFPDAKLQIVGNGPSRRYFEDQVKRLKMRRSIEFRGEVSGERLHSLYSEASVFVRPSVYESCGIAILEAMSMGKPIVASRVGGIPELVKNGEEGFLVEPGNSLQLAEAIRRILSDSSLRRKMGAKAKNKAKKEFDWKEKAKLTLQLYEDVLTDDHS